VLPQEHGAEEVHSAGHLLVEVALLVEKTADPSAMLGMTTENDQPTLRAKLHRESAAGLLLP
jgi:hypothetical protein